MHISDGVLPAWMLAAGFAATCALLYYSLHKIEAEEIPKISLVTAALFVASLMHFPIGPSSVHLVMNGLGGIMLGKRAFASMFVALALQAAFFQHGGLTALGVNALNMGVPALLAWQIFERRRGFQSPRREAVFGTLAGGVAVLLAVSMVCTELLAIGEGFFEIATMLFAVHIPVILAECAVCGTVSGFLARIRPEILIATKNAAI